MSAALLPIMNADEFITWAMQQPEGVRYELVDGRVEAMAPERLAHALTKQRITRRLEDAVQSAGLRCTVYPDGVAVEVDDHTIYEPDVMLHCGPALPGDATKVTDPLVIVEVRSPSTGYRDTGIKLADYFRIASLRHYLIVDHDRRIVVHHERDLAGAIATKIIREGGVRLDPPGLMLDGMFA